MSGFLSRLFRRGLTDPATDLPALPGDVTEDEFYDMTFAVTAQSVTDGLLHLSCRAQANGLEVGFDMTLPQHIEGGLSFNADGTPTLANAGLSAPVTFLPAGPATTALTATLSARTGHIAQDLSTYHDAPPTLPERLEVHAMHLEEGPVDLSQQSTRIKLFFEFGPAPEGEGEEDPEVEQLYAELFLIPDLPRGRLALHDKDYAYRPVLIDIFTAAWG